MIAMTPGDGGSGASAPDFIPVYAPEGHPANAVSVTAAPAPVPVPTPVPNNPDVGLISTFAALAPTTVSPVAAALTNVISGDSSDVQGVFHASSYSAPMPSATIAAPSAGTSAPSTAGIGGDTGTGTLQFPALATTEPTVANAATKRATVTPTYGGLTVRQWLIAAAVAFLVLR